MWSWVLVAAIALAADGDGDGVDAATDCDDAVAAIYPGAPEQIADGVDQDCDGLELCWLDGDGDGWAATGSVVASDLACTGAASALGDCDDAAADVHPGVAEACDGVDNDCDRAVDDVASEDAPTFYADADGDGWGDVTAPVAACAQPESYTVRAGDCDDADGARNPAAVELCDGADNDCDPASGDPNSGASTWWFDGDADGFGDPATATLACAAPADGWLPAGLPDPDDADAACLYGYPCTGFGCASARGASWLAAVGLLALRRPRARR